MEYTRCKVVGKFCHKENFMVHEEKCMLEDSLNVGFMKGNFNDDELSIGPNPCS
jgi:hypothetical protein